VLSLFLKHPLHRYADLCCVLAGFLAADGDAQTAVTFLGDVHSGGGVELGPLCKLVARSGERPDLELFEGLAAFAEARPAGLLGRGGEIVRRMRAAAVRAMDACRAVVGQAGADLSGLSREWLSGAREREDARGRRSGKEWRLMWSHLTSENAPWAYERSEIRYKRDFAAVVSFCPMRTKVNRRFDPHVRAARLRDARVSSERVDDSESTADGAESVFAQECCEINLTGAKATVFAVTHTDVVIGKNRFPLGDIEYVFWRRIDFEPTGVEIVLRSGRSFLLGFANRRSRDIVRLLKRQKAVRAAVLQLSPFADFVRELGIAKRWAAGAISNFEYLMWLNVIASRSFHDPSQYPVFPWVVADYESKVLNLTSERTFRPLATPIGALGADRLEDIIDRARDLRDFGEASFLYSAYVSCPLGVFLYFVRIEPYATMHIDMQGGRFDTANRLFHSLAHCWMSVTTQPNDFRELTPEFYYDPDFLTNANNFDLGVADTGPVSDVELPPWAASPIEFVYLQRKALESSFVSHNLNHWIDLVFGCLQRGDAALAAQNQYRDELYDDVFEREAPQARHTVAHRAGRTSATTALHSPTRTTVASPRPTTYRAADDRKVLNRKMPLRDVF
jgi:hypothetical protein